MTALDQTLAAAKRHAWTFVLLQAKSKNPASWCATCGIWTHACGHYPGTRRLTQDEREVREWLDRRCNLGIVGSNVAMLDFDENVLGEMCYTLGPLAPTVETGSGKHHVYLAGENSDVLPRSLIWKGKTVGQLIRKIGEYVACPPSIHPKTERPYTWLQDLGSTDLPPLPERWLDHLISAAPSRGKGKVEPLEIPDVIESGERHRTLFRIVRSLKLAGKKRDYVFDFTRRVNAALCNPPVPDRPPDQPVSDKFGEYLERCWRLPDREGFNPIVEKDWDKPV